MHWQAKVEGHERPLKAIQSRLNFTGFTSMSKRNFPQGGQLYTRTLINFLGHPTVYVFTREQLRSLEIRATLK